jgi:hypothetical protein
VSQKIAEIRAVPRRAMGAAYALQFKKTRAHRHTRTGAKPQEDIMKYGLALLLGIPIPIVAIWFLVQHC